MNPMGLSFDRAGSIIVVDRNALGGAVFRVNPSNGVQTVVTSGGSFDPFGVCVAPDGNILVTDFAYSSSRILRVNPGSGARSVLTVGGFLFSPWGITTNISGDVLVADQDALCSDCPSNGALIGVAASTGIQNLVSSGEYFRDPVGITVVTQAATPAVRSTWGHIKTLYRR